MGNRQSVRTIRLEGFWMPQDAEEFNADLKESLRDVAQQIPLSEFCTTKPASEELDFYQVDLKNFTPSKAVGVIHVSVIDRLPPADGKAGLDKTQHVRLGFELDRKNGELRLGKGFVRS